MPGAHRRLRQGHGLAQGHRLGRAAHRDGRGEVGLPPGQVADPHPGHVQLLRHHHLGGPGGGPAVHPGLPGGGAVPRRQGGLVQPGSHACRACGLQQRGG
eukprot:13446557-Alexandrium_andersonii.AAC.1